MRKIEKQLANAITSGQPVKTANTLISFDPVIDGSELEMRLHGHLIAKRFKNGELAVSLCGWNTRITRSRIGLVMRTLAPHSSYPAGIGVSSRRGVIRLHDARGETAITADGWHTLAL